MLSSYCIWAGWLGLFAVLELLAALGLAPWHTLSSTVWDFIQRTGGIAAIPIVGGLFVLIVHLVAPQVFERRKVEPPKE